MCSITNEQFSTLWDYAQWAGRGWKDKLRSDWMRSGSRFPGEWGHLQQLRNACGPKWLAAVKLPTEKPGVES